MPAQILLADDDAELRSVLRELLSDEGYEIREVQRGDEVVAAFNGSSPAPDLVLMDIRMPNGLDGIEVLRALRGQLPRPMPFIVMTAYSSASVAIEATQLGAFDYVIKPFELDHLLATIERFFAWKRSSGEAVALTGVDGLGDGSEVMIGSSPEMQSIYKAIGRVAGSEATVLITGETGTGKELVATLLHRRSTYARGPLIKVNCAALPETLLESELFGHEKGAFTSAIAQRKGRFELANKGSIFLDEIGEMTLATQKKLLRVLQEREFERVGGSTTIKIDTRVIAATNKHLMEEIAEGRFREDLYYRLNIIAIHLPPLRERKEDIPMLVEHFLHRFKLPRAEPARLTQPALDKLLSHEWPGNIRELQNVIERAVILASGGLITDLEIDVSGSLARPVIDVAQRLREGWSLAELLGNVEREAIGEALRIARGDAKAAAQMLGIDVERLKQVEADSPIKHGGK
ncbi:sigma-54 dependent transcriptional regulator [soil metagenome]